MAELLVHAGHMIAYPAAQFLLQQIGEVCAQAIGGKLLVQPAKAISKFRMGLLLFPKARIVQLCHMSFFQGEMPGRILFESYEKGVQVLWPDAVCQGRIKIIT